MLEQTGLGDVMEEAMIPTLSFLPTLTPADESLLLLKAAYDTLLKLTQVRFGDEKLKERRHKVLDKLLREGVLHGMNHCHQNVEIMRLLLVVMEKLIYKSDAHFIKHLKVRTAASQPNCLTNRYLGCHPCSLYFAHGSIRSHKSGKPHPDYQDSKSGRPELLASTITRPPPHRAFESRVGLLASSK